MTARSGLASLVLASTLCLSPARAATYYMATAGNDAADGQTPGTAWLTFTNAIARASNTDTVLVSAGTYPTPVTITNNKAITFVGVSGREATIVDAQATSNDPRRVFYITSAGSVLDGFTIRGGVSLGWGRLPEYGNCPHGDPGAGVYMTGGTIRNCSIAFNTTYYWAAGVCMTAGLVEDCLIYSNEVPSSAHDGCCNWTTCVGGIYIGGANATVQNCDIFSNIGRGAGWGPAGGAGVGIKSGKLLNSAIHHNLLYGGYGGCGINMDTASGGVVSNCQVYANGGAPGAGRGTGVFAGSGTIVNTVVSNNNNGVYAIDTMNAVSLRNVLIAGHPAQRAIRPWGGGTMDNCTLAGNAYGVDRNITTNKYSLAMRNCINTNSTAAFSADADPTRNVVVYMTNCCSTTLSGAGITATDSTNVNPMFENAAAGDYRLKKKSPLVNAGLNLPWMIGATDLAGEKRIAVDVVDMGCYENPAPAGTLILLL